MVILLSDGLLYHFKWQQDVVCRVIHGENKIVDPKPAHSWIWQQLSRHLKWCIEYRWKRADSFVASWQDIHCLRTILSRWKTEKTACNLATLCKCAVYREAKSPCYMELCWVKVFQACQPMLCSYKNKNNAWITLDNNNIAYTCILEVRSQAYCYVIVTVQRVEIGKWNC